MPLTDREITLLGAITTAVAAQQSDEETLQSIVDAIEALAVVATPIASRLSDGTDFYDARLDKAATYSGPALKSLGVASAAILAANASRRLAIIVNDSDAVVYLAVGAAAEANKGIRLNPYGGVAQFGGPGGMPLTLAAINGIATSATSNVTVQEAT